MAALTPEYLVAHGQKPEQPSQESSGVARVVVKQSRIRELSAQLLGVDDWRTEAAAWGRQRARDRAAAAQLLSLHGVEARPGGGAGAEDTEAEADDLEEAEQADQARRSGARVPLASKFPAWRRVRPPIPSRRPTDAAAQRGG